jgi:L-ribulose-5-phosphate 3-epimerase
MQRRYFLQQLTAMALAGNLSPVQAIAKNLGAKKIGACDWSLGQSANPQAFDIAKAIGLSGIQVNLGQLTNNLHLRKPEMQATYLAKTKETGVKITSLAIGELNEVPYKADSRTDQWVHDSIDVANVFDVKVILLAFFAKNDLRNDPKGIDTVIGKLKEVMPYAQKHNKILGIESYLTAEEHLYIMEKVNSPNLKVYYDFRNATDAGNNIYKELPLLGNKNICEIHIKENGYLLGKGTLDWQKVKNTLEEIEFSKKKWAQIEWAKPKDIDYIPAHKQNIEFLKSLK